MEAVRNSLPAVDYLAAVEKALATYGRPRKNPGKNRPVAVVSSPGHPDGLPVSRITGSDINRIRRLSLPGAFVFAEYMVPCTHKTRREAKKAFCSKVNGRLIALITPPETSSELDVEITKIDHDMPDTREILRILKATQKKLRREGKVLASSSVPSSVSRAA